MLISDNGISKVWRRKDSNWVFKQQPDFLTTNEIYCLKIMYPSGYVPKAEQVSSNIIRIEYIRNEPVTEPDLLWYYFPCILKALEKAEIRHSDLTRYAVLVRGNRPYIIDFAESRLFCDPRPDKRLGGDEFWLKKTFEELCS